MVATTGKPAPDFTLPTDGGGEVKLADLKGKKVVLYFYPKDMTSGCTAESCDFRDRYPDFNGLDVEIIGISKDSIARHDKFKEKHDLPFTLASDETDKVCEAYGVWRQKSMYGKKFMGIERSTFLIDATGVVRGEWRKVKVKGHADAVLAAAQEI